MRTIPITVAASMVIGYVLAEVHAQWWAAVMMAIGMTMVGIGLFQIDEKV